MQLFLKKIKDLWIFQKSGNILFSQVSDPKIEEHLFVGLVSALNTYAELMKEGGISNFTVANIKYSMIKKSGILFLANGNKKTKKTELIREVKIIADRFLDKYSDEYIKRWFYDPNRFNDFEFEFGKD